MEIQDKAERQGSWFSNLRQGREENVILIADDDPYMRILAREAVKGSGTIYEVAEGASVLAEYKTHAPDVLFLDIHMPGKSGLEVLEEIFSVDPDAYVVMLTGDTSKKSVEKAMAQKIKGFVAKPFSRGKMLECIKKCPTIRPPA